MSLVLKSLRFEDGGKGIQCRLCTISLLYATRFAENHAVITRERTQVSRTKLKEPTQPVMQNSVTQCTQINTNVQLLSKCSYAPSINSL